MGNISGVVGQLKKELGRAQQEVQRFTAALTALGSSNSNGRSTLSAAARKENQPRAEGAMAECLEWIAASENYGLDSREAHHIGFSPQENRGGTVGEGESGEEDGIKYGARISPLLRWRLFSLGRNHCGLDAR